MSAEPDRTHQKPPFLKRVRIRNYKSIKFCDVELEPLTVLVGRNGSGKSNFVDALGFLRDVEWWGLNEAVQYHGGMDAVTFRGTNEKCLEFELTFSLESLGTTDRAYLVYSQVFTADAHGQLHRARERVSIRDRAGDEIDGYTASFNQLIARLVWVMHKADRPHEIPFAGRGTSVLRAIATTTNSQIPMVPITEMRTYNFIPAHMSVPMNQTLAPITRDGRNIVGALSNIKSLDPGAYTRVGQYLRAITGTVEFDSVQHVGGYEVLLFRVQTNGESRVFPAASMSDGTLRAFASLVAVFQLDFRGSSPSLVAIEEPETSLHPAAMHALVDALDEATGRTQILITTHSTELLDNPVIQPRNVRVVEMIDGETVITGVDEATEEIYRERFDTLGGLERQNQLKTNYADRERQKLLAAEASQQ